MQAAEINKKANVKNLTRLRKPRLSKIFSSLPAVTCLWILLTFDNLHAAKFFCSSGNVTCLIAAINTANELRGKHTINLEPGVYTLQATADETIDGPSGLPSIRRSIRIRATADDRPTVIERDTPEPVGFFILHIPIGGELNLEGVIVRGIGSSAFSRAGTAIFNAGITTLQNSTVTESFAFDVGAIYNSGELIISRSIIANNNSIFTAGGIDNQGGTVLVENSTIAHNVGADFGGGGVFNGGSMIVKDSSIVFNTAAFQGTLTSGGGVNNEGSLVVINSTIAKNAADQGGAIFNGGLVSITNSTIRENETLFDSPPGGSSLYNQGGILRVRNTIVAGNNTLDGTRPDCFGTITSLGNNLVGDPSGCFISLLPSDTTGDPGLDALVGTGDDDLPGRAYYPVLPGSAVIGAGNRHYCPKRDQLGNRRDRDCEIGSIEFLSRIAKFH